MSYAVKMLLHFAFDLQAVVSLNKLNLAMKLSNCLVKMKGWTLCGLHQVGRKMQQKHKDGVCTTAVAGTRKADKSPRDRPASARVARYSVRLPCTVTGWAGSPGGPPHQLYHLNNSEATTPRRVYVIL